MFTGILGLLHLVIAIWAVLQVFKSSAGTGSKILWTLLIFLFPLGGLIIWFFFGPKAA